MIRPLGFADLDLAAALHAACFPEEPWDAVAFAHLLASPGMFGLLSADETGPEPQPTGILLARAIAGEAEIVTIGVLPARRCTGVGAALLNAALVHARNLGAESMFLEVAEDNKSAYQLYVRHGFVQVGRRPAYYRRANGRVAALVLSRLLNSFVNEA